jgi:hypothetical protein
VLANDRRYSELRQADAMAVSAALSAADRAVAAALAAADRAVSKAEEAAEKRFDGVNEFRGQLADQASTLMPRAEAEIRLANLERFMNQSAGRRVGGSDVWGYVFGAVGLLIAGASIFLHR